MRLARRLQLVALTATALICVSASATAHAGAPAASASVISNGGFEVSLRGWRPHNARVIRLRRGVAGRGAARVLGRTRGRRFSLYHSPKPVRSTAKGDRYLAEAWMRAPRGGRVCISLRELSGRRVVATAQHCRVARPGWRKLGPLAYEARGKGHRLGVSVVMWRARRGRAFDLDRVRLAVHPAPTHADTPSASAGSAPPQRLLYADSSPLNQPVPAGAVVDRNSAAMVAQLRSEIAAKGWRVSVKEWTSPVYFADGSTPRFDVPVSSGPYRGKVWSQVPIPQAAAADPSSDGSMVVLDRSRSCEYDFWRARRSADGWAAQWANTLPTNGTGIYPHAEGVRASGFGSAAGLIFPDELAAGRIDHALTFTMQHTKAGGPVPPATASDGWSTVPGAIPEGARLQLDPGLDLDSFRLTAWQKTIARALQQYGMYLTDTGGAVAFQAVHPQSVSTTYPWGDVPAAAIPAALAAHLRVLELGNQFETLYRFVPTQCATLR